MTIAHRAFSAAFGAGHSRNLPWIRAARHQGIERTDSRPYGAAGTITSSPWEGLYLEDEQIAKPAPEDSMETSTELERFLSSLMYGE
jgi:hypothetical protein